MKDLMKSMGRADVAEAGEVAASPLNELSETAIDQVSGGENTGNCWMYAVSAGGAGYFQHTGYPPDGDD